MKKIDIEMTEEQVKRLEKFFVIVANNPKKYMVMAQIYENGRAAVRLITLQELAGEVRALEEKERLRMIYG